MGRGTATALKIRELVIKEYYKGNSMRKISKYLNLAKSTVADIIKKYGETANVNIKGKSTGRPRIITVRNQRQLIKVCRNLRRATLREVTATWNAETGLNVSRECCRKYIHKAGLHFYKVCVFLGST